MSIRGLLAASALFLALQFGAVCNAFAGDPGPYRLVFLDISEEPYQDGQQLMIDLRKIDQLSADWKECFICTGESKDVGNLYLYTVPVGLSVEALRKAVAGDDAALQKMQKVLNQFADADGLTVNGLLIYQHVEGKVTVYSLGAVPGDKLHSVSKPVKVKLLLSSLDKLLEQVAARISRPV
jgi:hypothetical protein